MRLPDTALPETLSGAHYLVLDGVQEERIPQWDLRVYRAVVKGWFPQLYILLRVREKLTKKKWGIRR